MSEQDFASGTAYNALAPTLADTPVIPWSDLAVTNPPETPLPVGLQVVPTLAALTAQGQSNPVLLQADAQRRLLTAADSDLTGTTSAAVNVGDSAITLYSATGFIIGRSILYVPLIGGVLNPAQIERHTVTAITGSTLSIGDSISNAGGIGSIVVEIPDVQTPPQGRIVASGNTANGFKQVQVAVSERITAVGFFAGSYGDMQSLTITGVQSNAQYQPISVYSTPGLYIAPIVGGADTLVNVGFTFISAFDTFAVIAYETIPAAYQNNRGGVIGEGLFYQSNPVAGTQAIVTLFSGLPFGTTIVDIIATLRNGGGVADNAKLQWMPNINTPATLYTLGDLAVSATAGDKDRVILRGIRLPVNVFNGSKVQFANAPAANNVQSILCAAANV